MWPLLGAQVQEDFMGDVQFLERSWNNSEEVFTSVVTAFFDTSYTGESVISYLIVTRGNLRNLQWHPVVHHEVIVPSVSAAPLRIVGVLDARWCGLRRMYRDQRIFFAPKIYTTRFLVTDVEFGAPFDVVFGLPTMQNLGLFDRDAPPAFSGVQEFQLRGR